MRPQWKIELQEKVKSATVTLLDDCNACGAGSAIADGILDGLSRQHRTLQQAFIRVLLQVISAYGARYESEDRSMWFDGRNQGAGQSCAAIAKFVEESDDIYLPTI